MAHIKWLAAQQPLSFSVWFLFCHAFSCACCQFIFFFFCWMEKIFKIRDPSIGFLLLLKKKVLLMEDTWPDVHIHYNLCVLNCATHFNSFWYFAKSTIFNRCVKKNPHMHSKLTGKSEERVSSHNFSNKDISGELQFKYIFPTKKNNTRK